MARSFHRPQARVRVAQWAGQAFELVIMMGLFGLVALWMTGAPVAALLPIHPPI
jgi:hypothetical protein